MPVLAEPGGRVEPRARVDGHLRAHQCNDAEDQDPDETDDNAEDDALRISKPLGKGCVVELLCGKKHGCVLEEQHRKLRFKTPLQKRAGVPLKRGDECEVLYRGETYKAKLVKVVDTAKFVYRFFFAKLILSSSELGHVGLLERIDAYVGKHAMRNLYILPASAHASCCLGSKSAAAAAVERTARDDEADFRVAVRAFAAASSAGLSPASPMDAA